MYWCIHLGFEVGPFYTIQAQAVKAKLLTAEFWFMCGGAIHDPVHVREIIFVGTTGIQFDERRLAVGVRHFESVNLADDDRLDDGESLGRAVAQIYSARPWFELFETVRSQLLSIDCKRLNGSGVPMAKVQFVTARSIEVRFGPVEAVEKFPGRITKIEKWPAGRRDQEAVVVADLELRQGRRSERGLHGEDSRQCSGEN